MGEGIRPVKFRGGDATRNETAMPSDCKGLCSLQISEAVGVTITKVTQVTSINRIFCVVGLCRVNVSFLPFFGAPCPSMSGLMNR